MLALVILLAAAAAARAPAWHELSAEYSYEQYVRDFRKTHSEDARATFQTNLEMILKHNSQVPAPSWRMGVNQFTDMTREQFKSHLGHAGRHVSAAYDQLPRRKPAHVENLPASVDWREKGIISNIKNQGMCGSCWAHASAETAESYVALETGLLFTLSTQQLVSCAPNPDKCGGTGGCQGSIPELAYDYIKQAGGWTTEWQMPYSSFYGSNGNCTFKRDLAVATVDGFVKLESNNYTDVMNHLASTGPLAVNVQANTWQHYESGVAQPCTNSENIEIDHVVQLVGYGTDDKDGDYFLVRNSWDVTWGEKGYIRLKRSAMPECGTDANPAAGTGCSGGPATVKVCGSCGILYDVSYPEGAKLV